MQHCEQLVLSASTRNTYPEQSVLDMGMCATPLQGRSWWKHTSFLGSAPWSLAILWPAKDHKGIYYAPGTPEHAKAGQPLAGSFYACLVSLAGDQDYLAKFLQ